MLVVSNHTFAESIFSDYGKANDYSGEYKFNPFFKTEEYQDLPPAPKLSKFDKTILGVCDSWDDIPKNNSFMSALNDPDYKALETKILLSIPEGRPLTERGGAFDKKTAGSKS